MTQTGLVLVKGFAGGSPSQDPIIPTRCKHLLRAINQRHGTRRRQGLPPGLAGSPPPPAAASLFPRAAVLTRAISVQAAMDEPRLSRSFLFFTKMIQNQRVSPGSDGNV